MYFAHYLLANCEDSKIRHLLEHLDFTFIPVVNVVRKCLALVSCVGSFD